MKQVLGIVLSACALFAASADAPLSVERVSLPFDSKVDELVIRTNEEWQAFLSERPSTIGTPAPCDWSTSMLVAARPEGTSACSEPPSGIEVEIVDGEYVVTPWIAHGEGDCYAYFRPLVAACVATSSASIRFASEPTFVYISGELFVFE